MRSSARSRAPRAERATPTSARPFRQHDVLGGFKGLVIWALATGRYRAADVIHNRTAAEFRAIVAASIGT